MLRLKSHNTKHRVLNIVYCMLFSELIVYSVFTTIYLDNRWPASQWQPDHYDIENVTVRPFFCSFSISSQYQTTPRYICYLLLVFTIVIRNYVWLAAGAAASVMTYSGTAAIHLIILFVTNNRFHSPKAKTHCEHLPLTGVKGSFLACTGVNDPDSGLVTPHIEYRHVGRFTYGSFINHLKDFDRQEYLSVLATSPSCRSCLPESVMARSELALPGMPEECS